MALSRAGRRPGKSDAPGVVEVVVTQDDLRDLVRAIQRHGEAKAVRAELRKGLREAVKPLVPKARAAVRGQSSSAPRRQGRSSLRADMARSVQVKVDLGLRSDRIGVRIRLDGGKLRDRPKSLTYRFEGVKPWRHPVFGDRDTWVQQEPRGFLTEVVQANRAAVLRDVERTCEAIGRRIDR